jgi:penicillin-binding protein 1A
VGGIDHQFFKYDHVRSRRQAGSTFKPFVYAAALEQGVEPCRPFPNQRIAYPDYDDWSPRNADNRYGGEYKMREALAHSVNTVSAQLIMEAGINNTIDLAERTGIESSLPEVPALALGVASVSLLEMVSAYASFSNGGHRVKPVYITRIADRYGQTLRRHEAGPAPEPAVSAENAAMVLELLKGVVEEGSAAGLRTRHGLRMDIAGKTGTSQNHSDGWFIGITPDLVAGVWVGAESPLVRFDNLQLGQGAATALPVWGEFMSRLTRTRAFAAYGSSRFPAPPRAVADRLNCGEEETPERTVSAVVAFFERLFGGSDAGREDRQPSPAGEAGAETAGADGAGEPPAREAETSEREQRRTERERRREEKARERIRKAEERAREEAKKVEERLREEAKKLEERLREEAQQLAEKVREEAQKRREDDGDN